MRLRLLKSSKPLLFSNLYHYFVTVVPKAYLSARPADFPLKFTLNTAGRSIEGDLFPLRLSQRNSTLKL